MLESQPCRKLLFFLTDHFHAANQNFFSSGLNSQNNLDYLKPLITAKDYGRRQKNMQISYNIWSEF